MTSIPPQEDEIMEAIPSNPPSTDPTTSIIQATTIKAI